MCKYFGQKVTKKTKECVLFVQMLVQTHNHAYLCITKEDVL